MSLHALLNLVADPLAYSAGRDAEQFAGFQCGYAYLSGLHRLERDWDGGRSEAISPAIIEGSRRVYVELWRSWAVLPAALYPTPTGEIVFEWRFGEAIRVWLFIEGSGTGEVMVSFSAEDTRFYRVSWGTSQPKGIFPKLGGFDAGYPLAA